MKPFRKNLRLWIAALLLIGGGAAYLWYGRLNADSVLEEASLEELQQIVKDRPDYARAHLYLGRQLGKKRQFEPALQTLARATELEPDDAEIGAAYAAAVNAVEGQAGAFRVMNDFLKRHPDSQKMKTERDSLLGSLKRAAEGFAGGRQYADAAKYYRQLLAQEPNNASHYQGLGLVLAGEKKIKEAKAALEKALSLDPGLSEAKTALEELTKRPSPP
jgi:tetratricopeptide (TPR) repeat protein